MSKEERFGCFIDEWDDFDWCIKDNKNNEQFEYLEDITKLLNQQDQRIVELEKQLAKSEKSKEINIKERDKICIEMATDYNRQILELKQQLALTESALKLASKV